MFLLIMLALSLLANTQNAAAAMAGGPVVDFNDLVEETQLSADDMWSELLTDAKPSIVRVVGEHCSLCVTTAPIYRDVARAYNRHVNFIDIEYHKNRGILKPLHVKTLPSFLYVSKGKVTMLKQHSSVNREVLVKGIEDYFQVKEK